MAKHIVETMLPEHDAKIHKLSLHERKWLQLEMCIYDIFCIFCMSNLSFSAMDGDQLVDFYWIDPMLTAERIAAKSQYAGHMYYQFELEESSAYSSVQQQPGSYCSVLHPSHRA